MTASPNYLPEVRNQYEDLPYPMRDPADERKRLMVSYGSMLDYLSHYGYGGRLKPDETFRVLVAGGGTGDATIFWAEQLRACGGQVVYLDLSDASLQIAKQRAEIRQLDNIEFRQGSLLDLPEMEVGAFDHINCSGVLHHLADPVAGLNALKLVLREDGIINLMVYGWYLRMRLYQMQDLMHALTNEVSDSDQKITHTKTVLGLIKDTIWGRELHHIFNHEIHQMGDASLYDLYLHSQDRAYTVPQLYDWIESCGLTLSHWVANDMSRYKTLFSGDAIPEPALRTLVQAKPAREREAIMEMMAGNMGRHHCYVSHHALEAASPSDETLIPDFSFFSHYDKLQNHFQTLNENDDGHPLELKIGLDHRQFHCTPLLRQLLQGINGERSIADIIDGVEAPRDQAKAEFDRLYHALHSADWLLLRAPSVARYTNYRELQHRCFDQSV